MHHLALATYFTFSAFDVLAGLLSMASPFLKADFVYLSPLFAIFVVQPVSQVITAADPSDFHVPTMPSPERLALAEPSAPERNLEGFTARVGDLPCSFEGICGHGASRQGEHSSSRDRSL